MSKERTTRKPQNRRDTGVLVEAGKDTRFKPGVCPNPGGRPKLKILSDAIREKLGEVQPDGRTNAEVIADKLIEAAKSGEVYAIKEIADRVEGKSKTSIEITDDVSRLTDEELQDRIDSLVAELGYVRKGTVQ